MDRGSATSQVEPLRFRGGVAGALAPFASFLAGVGWLGLAGAPDERGFWPILLAALTLGLLLARERDRYCRAAVRGVSQPMVALMVLAWLLAGVLGSLLAAAGLLEALIWLSAGAGVSGGGFAAAAFLVCCLVSTATGTSLGTILVAGPLLYPAGAALGVGPAWLIGAILAGSTFGDNVSPISDTTIASAGTQGADIGGVVRSRMKYALPSAALALLGYAVLGGTGDAAPAAAAPAASPRGLPMLAAPALAVGLLLARRHLLEGLLMGSLAACGLGLAFGLLVPGQLVRIEPGSFAARGLLVEGVERGVGISIFTVLLVALVATLEATGLVERLVRFARSRVRGPARAERWIVAAASGAVLLTTHSVVAILAVGAFARETGEVAGVGRYRRANLLDMTVCTWPFLLPYMIPTVLAANTTAAGLAAGAPRVAPFAAGLHNLYSWALLLGVLVAVLTGYGRSDGREAGGAAAGGTGLDVPAGR